MRPQVMHLMRRSWLDLALKADASVSTQTLSVRANDGIAWGPWKDFTLTTTPPPNAKPVSLEDR